MHLISSYVSQGIVFRTKKCSPVGSMCMSFAGGRILKLSVGFGSVLESRIEVSFWTQHTPYYYCLLDQMI